MTTQSINKNGRITIPVEMRRKLNIKPGSKVTVEIRGNEIVLRPLKSLGDLSGTLHDYAGNVTDDWETVRQKAMQAVAEDDTN